MKMRSLLFGVAALAGVALSGCVSLGVSQQDSETAYTLAATASDVFLLSGKASADAAGQVCLGDIVAYRILSSTRNVADNVSYTPADSAHAALLHDGAKLAPDKCGGS